MLVDEFLLGWYDCCSALACGCSERLLEGFTGCHRFTLGVLIRFHVSNVKEVASV